MIWTKNVNRTKSNVRNDWINKNVRSIKYLFKKITCFCYSLSIMDKTNDVIMFTSVGLNLIDHLFSFFPFEFSLFWKMIFNLIIIFILVINSNYACQDRHLYIDGRSFSFLVMDSRLSGRGVFCLFFFFLRCCFSFFLSSELLFSFVVNKFFFFSFSFEK